MSKEVFQMVEELKKRYACYMEEKGAQFCFSKQVEDIVIENDGWTTRTKDKKPSAHYENTVIITNEGVEILTL